MLKRSRKEQICTSAGIQGTTALLLWGCLGRCSESQCQVLQVRFRIGLGYKVWFIGLFIGCVFCSVFCQMSYEFLIVKNFNLSDLAFWRDSELCLSSYSVGGKSSGGGKVQFQLSPLLVSLSILKWEGNKEWESECCWCSARAGVDCAVSLQMAPSPAPAFLPSCLQSPVKPCEERLL